MGKIISYFAQALKAARLAVLALVTLFAAAAVEAAPVTVVAHDAGYYTSLAKHVQRWLKGQGIASDVVTPAGMAAALGNAKIAFLVGFVEPTAAELKTLRACRARGTKLVVFHTASSALGALMGVTPLGYTAAPSPGRWSRMNFDTKALAGAPASVLQTSTVLQRAAPVKGRARVLATWADRAGRPTGDAAWIASDAGWWMTHVLLADGDEALKAQLLAAMCGAVDARLWNYRVFAAKAAAEQSALTDYARRQQPRVGEIHAVWDHSGCGLYPGDWPRTMRLLQASHVTDIFVNVAGAGFAHYASGVLPRSKTFSDEGDQLAKCLAAAKGTGIRVHAWILCFTATRATPERLETYRRNGWRLKDRDGRLTEYLDPANAAVRGHLVAAVDEMVAGYPALAGVHLDFVRWYERSVKPKNAAETISRFVANVRRHVRQPLWLTTAVLGKYPSCVASVGQDWEGWIDAGLVDYAVPMDYTENTAMLTSLLDRHALSKARARRIIAGLGVTANESRLDARQVIDQANLVRTRGLAGVALFDLDVTLEKQVLPYLRLGLW